MNDRWMLAAFERFDGHSSIVVRWTPPEAARARVLFVPAFGDEMNQTRRMVRLTAEALVERSIASTVFDPHGTGDSSAGFAEATVERWLADFAAVLERMRADRDEPIVLCACRLGVALAAELTHRVPEASIEALVGWAPLLQGRAQLSALQRAAKIAAGRRPGAERVDAKAEWTSGRIAFLGGYPISPALAEQLDRLDATAAPRVRAATLIDVRPPAPEGTVSPSEALRNRARAWQESGVAVEVLVVEGAPFWNVPDLVDLPSLVEATAGAVERHVRESRS